MSNQTDSSSPARPLFWAWLVAAVAFAAFVVLQPLFMPQATPKPGPATPEAAKPTVQAPPVKPARLEASVPAFNPDEATYALLAWSKEGMRFFADGEPYVSLRSPSGFLRAQLVERGSSPRIVTEDVEIRYAIEEGFDHPSRHARFWEFSESLLGRKLDADTGPGGAAARGVMRLNDALDAFEVSGLPEAPYPDAGGYNAYPLVAVQARDVKTGRVLAETRAALPVSTALGCKNCHGGPWRQEAGPDAGGVSQQTGGNILAAHDRINGTDLMVRAKAGVPVACQSCHADASEGAEGDKSLLSLSAAVHGWHASYMPGQGADACVSCHPAGGQGGNSLRDLHAGKELTCLSCHGPMEDLALSVLKSESEAGKRGAARLMDKLTPRAVKTVAEIAPRQAWAMQPDCSGCHDFSAKPNRKTVSAANKWVGGADKPLFTERRDEMDKMACQACHGAPHALYPSFDPVARDRDNLQSVQYQGLARPMGANGNCQVCHTDPMDVSAHHPIPERQIVKVGAPAGSEQKRPRVGFPHDAHDDMDCRTCHHKGYAPGVKQTCSASGCHDLAAPTTAEERSSWKYYRNAFHGQGFSCNACHQALVKAGKAAGPVECKGCHVEK